MLKIAITGSTGLVGSRIIELLNNDFQFIPLLQHQIDITDKVSTQKFLHSIEFDVLLHLAAYTNVDKAEEEKELANKINVEGTRNIFETVMEKNKKIIYISTDYVFDGKNPPYSEQSVPNPIGNYGISKYEGEKIIGTNGMIVRISYPYRSAFEEKKDFMRTLKSLLENKRPLKMITDTLITPTFIDDIAYGLRYLFTNFSQETFHLVGKTSHTPYEAAMVIAKTFHLDTNLIQQTTFDEYYKGKYARAKNTQIMSNKNNFYSMRSFPDGLEEIKRQLGL